MGVARRYGVGFLGKVLAATAAVSLLAGCAGDIERTEPAEVAAEVLDAYVTDETLVSGFTISETRITAMTGEPPASRQVYPEPDESETRPVEPAHPIWVPGGELDVTGSASRAVASLEQCGEEWGMAQVQVLSAQAVVTRTICEVDGNRETTILLGDDELPSLPGPITEAMLNQVWGEIEAAGLVEDLVRVEFDLPNDDVKVQFKGPVTDRTYGWIRGLENVDSLSNSHSVPITMLLDLDALAPARIIAALDEVKAGLEDPDRVVRLELQPTETGAEMLLEDAEYNLLATVTLD